MSSIEWSVSGASGEHTCETALAVNESDGFCIQVFGSEDIKFCIDVIVAATRYENARGPVAVARTAENKKQLDELDKNGDVKLMPYAIGNREMVAVVAIKAEHTQ